MVRIQDILHRYKQHPEVQAFTQAIQSFPQGRFRMRGTVGSQTAFLINAIYHNIQRNTLIILSDKEDALYFQHDLKTLMPQKEILYFPVSYRRPYEVEQIDNANVLARAEVLNEINHTRNGRMMVVTFAEAMAEKVINRRSLVKNTLEIKKSDRSGMDFITDMLEAYGFSEAEFAYEPGQFARRGGILDIFSYAHELPYRLEFFGDEIESIRVFDPITQLSEKEVNNVSLIPNIQTNLLLEEKVSLLEYLPDNTLVISDNIDFLKAELDKTTQKAAGYYGELQASSGGAAASLPPKHFLLDGEECLRILRGMSVLEIGSRQYFREHDAVLEWAGSAQPAFRKEFSLLAQHLKDNRTVGVENLILTESEKQIQRLTEIFQEIDPDVSFNGVHHEVHEGFLDKKLNLACYTDHQIFERYHRYRSTSQAGRSQALTIKELRELQPGDYITHITHGIGKFAGLHKIKIGETVQEAVKVIYRDGDEIFVNVNALHKISKYSGKDGAMPTLSKLGSAEWSKAKARTKKRLKELAFDLISLYARRKATKGFSFSADTYMQQELEASFMFEDTPDQVKCTDEVKKDMENSYPMDRLVCGDVGFGKTEIAIRAAFKAVCDGKQVAILVPTTILALQHYHTFSDRLKEMPVTVDYLNRFKSAKDQTATLKRLEEGKIDILIGTHRLVSKDVKFKDLGLMIIDEEQKFGVSVKEKLKLFKANVDTLTLTATPIPRTLQFSLLGIRDMSVITTPPPNRQPVETIVCGLDAERIRDAVAYELKRGGQVFFIHNRIEDLQEIAAMIKKLVPDARICIGHGQLAPDAMEKVMEDFIERQYDVLVATTIIESGLDISNANTILINQAHMYGLSDLHQMRGRVGRSNRKAFCFLIAPPESVLTKDAKKRLKALEEFSDLGSGIHIALRDLDIRGAGDLFGAEQSGFISEVGYEMYHKILDEAVMELKEEHFSDLFADEIRERRKTITDDCLVETDQYILIPESYIPSVSERMSFYNRIAASAKEDDMRLVMKEMVDRFGALPEPVQALFDTVRIRELGKQLGFEKVVLKSGVLKLFFVSDKTSSYFGTSVFSNIIAFVTSHAHRIAFSESTKYLSLTIKGILGTKDIYMELMQLQQWVKAQSEAAHAG